MQRVPAGCPDHHSMPAVFDRYDLGTDHPCAGFFGRDRLREHERARIDVACTTGLMDAGKALRKAEPGKSRGEVAAGDQRCFDTEPVAGALDIFQIVKCAARSGRRNQATDREVEFDTALPCNFRIAVDRATRQSRPDRIIVDRAGDAGIVVVAGEHTAVVRPVLRLVRPDESDIGACSRQMARRCGTHHALADDDKVNALRHALPRCLLRDRDSMPLGPPHRVPLNINNMPERDTRPSSAGRRGAVDHNQSRIVLTLPQ